MDISTILNIVLSTLIAVLGYFLRGAHSEVRELRTKHETLREDFNTLSLNMANNFVSKRELERIEATLKAIDDRVMLKLEGLGTRLDDKFETLGDKIDTRIENIGNKFEERIHAFADDVYAQLRKKADKD